MTSLPTGPIGSTDTANLEASVGTAGIDRLADMAAALVPTEGRAILGIVGSPGSGKSTLAEQLLEELRERHPDGWVAHVPMDGYHLADDQLRRLGILDRKGAPATFDAFGYGHLLDRLKSHSEEWVYVPGFERNLEQPLAAALVVPPAARLVITEGNYLLLDDPPWRSAAAQVDQSWFVTTDPDVRVERLVARHITFGKDPDAARAWVQTVDEGNARLVEQSAGRADLLIANDARGWRVVESAAGAPDESA